MIGSLFAWIWTIQTSFLTPQGTLPWQPILWQNLGICVHSADWHLKTVCNIAIPIQKYNSILCKYDENRSSNPRDYEGNKCTFMDETAKIGLSHQISHQTARPIFTNASALVMYVWGLQNLHKFRGSPWDVAIVTDQFWGLFAGVKIDRHYSLLSLSKTECIIALRIRVLIVALIALHCLKRWWKSVQ